MSKEGGGGTRFVQTSKLFTLHSQVYIDRKYDITCYEYEFCK